MRCLFPLMIFAALVLESFQAATAQEAAADASPADAEAVHDELRALRDEAVDAYQKKDIERLLRHMHKDVVITLQNAERLQGHQEIKDFHERMNEGDSPKVKVLESTFEVDELSILHGEDTAVSHGQMNDLFELDSGWKFSLASRWTATLVKEEGKWLVASFHISTNMFDNGVLDALLKWNTLKSAGIAFVAGVILSLLAMKLFGTLRKPKPE